MTVKTVIRKVKTKAGTTGILYFRIYERGITDFRVATNISVKPEYWSSKANGYLPRVPESEITSSERKEVNRRIQIAMTTIKDTYPLDGGDAKWLATKLAELNLRGEDVGIIDVAPASTPQTPASTSQTTVSTPQVPKAKPQTPKSTRQTPKSKAIILPSKPKPQETTTLLEYFAQYLEESEFNDWHREAQTSVKHRLERYEKWVISI
jgi:hypothetical protein